jgi:hypothetical protein
MESENVEPDPHDALLVAQRSHQIWSGYLENIQKQTRITESCIRIENILGPTPAFPLGWLKRIQKDRVRHYRDGSSELYLSGQGYWQDTASSCQLGPKAIETSLLVGIQRPRRFKLVEDGRFREWPGVIRRSYPVEGNHLALLVFAWAYILSAYWIETSTVGVADSQSADGEMEYVTSEIEDSTGSALEIDIGVANCNALNWWRAITSPGQGWRSTVRFNGMEYQSPWSIFVSDIPRIEIRASCASSESLRKHRGSSSQDALGFLISFCETHGLHDQFLAALSVAMLIPTAGGRENQLPVPKNNIWKQHHNFSDNLWDEAARIPYYMSIACNTRGVNALLSSPFFDASTACNLASAWLDPMFRILDRLLDQNDYNAFLSVLNQRASSVAPLWLGALLIGFEGSTMQTARLGTPVIELIAAAWVGVDISFITAHHIQKKPPNAICRVDECRLMFFMNCLGYERPPICPWRPFGAIPFEEAELEVQVHSSCGHLFKYCGWSWDLMPRSSSLDAGYRQISPCKVAVDIMPRISKQTIITKISSDIASETATRSIFSWLRGDGWPRAEKHIREHEWISGFGDDSDDGGNMSKDSTKSSDSTSIRRWLLQTQQSATDG